MKNIALGSLLGLLVAVVAGCGGGGDAGGTPAATPPVVTPPIVAATGGTITGTILKGPVNSATVCLFKIDNTVAGKKGSAVVATAPVGSTAVNGCVVSASDGAFSLTLPEGFAGDVLLEASGGTYCSNEAVFDKANLVCGGSGGTSVAMGTNSLRSVVKAPASGSTATLAVTPFSTAALANTIAAGALNVDAFNTQFAQLVGSLGLPASISAETVASDPQLQSALAAVSKIIGSLPSNYTQTIADLASAKYRYAGGNFAVPPGNSSAAQPTLDLSKCATPVVAGVVTGGGSCAADAVGDWSATLANPTIGQKCTITIAGGVFTLTDGARTFTATMNAEIADQIVLANNALSSISPYDRYTDGGNITMSLVFVKGVLGAVTAGITPMSGAPSSLSCFNT
jgi:hypothetical protein